MTTLIRLSIAVLFISPFVLALVLRREWRKIA